METNAKIEENITGRCCVLIEAAKESSAALMDLKRL